ncbi:TonB-dependent receptor [Dyadobacter fanqingshengii]|uniref:TonB-dependent receptor n=1 Tax=Dyadobacter fanqingshengii TaxID=2906443 RepID=A0A9X1TEX3_9BACT|nr:TonB-dependent receptor [Dyadobacter fanqingshengii]MCF0038947.1 TonB-dependent receptor [Dyadobacter fanqingshengii]USJ34230.1 TonB-dependent receptor [Dyadobacter fanqingshengii]
MHKKIPLKRVVYKVMSTTAKQLIIAILCCGISFAHTLHGQELLNKDISLKVESLEVKRVLQMIEKQADVKFVYSTSSIQGSQNTNLKEVKGSLDKVLDQLLTPLNVSYEVVGNSRILLRKKPQAPTGNEQTLQNQGITAERNITGKVLDEKGAGLPGVNILLVGSQQGTSTNENGDYRIAVPDQNATLKFSFIGYVSQEVVVDKEVINVTLAPDVSALKEVVVVGYGTQEKKDVTGAVSSVKGADFQNLPSGGAQQALQGRAAGVNIVRNGGAPGDAGSIQIRGFGTVNNSSPLVVIDGIPSGNMNDVNPNDIESIEILKDASASAIYGTRAANGVILVTTKRGKFDAPLSVTVNAYLGVTNRIKSLDVLTAPQLAEMKQKAYTNDDLDIPAIWEDKQYQNQLTNWQEELLKQGVTRNYDASLRGGGKYSTFAISGGYYNEDGIIGKSNYTRYTFRINSDHKVGSRIKIGQNFQYTNTHNSGPDTQSSQTGLLFTAIRFHPGLPVRNANGSYGSTDGLGAFGDLNNPIFTVDTQDKNNIRNRFLGNLTGELEIVNGLKLRTNLAMDATFSDSQTFDIKVNDQFRKNSYNQLSVGRDKTWSFLQEYFLSYDKAFGKNSLSVVGGYTSQTFKSIYANQWGREFASEDPSLRYMQYAGIIVSVPLANGGNGGRSYDALGSWFGRVNYSFNDRYLFTATMRSDGSSKFAPGNQWGVFPAFSLGWRLSEEDFFKNALPIFSNFKLTGGWGQLGNQNVASLQYLALINSTFRYAFGNGGVQNQVSGAAQSRLANLNIGWETAEMSNFGLEAGLFKNSLYLSANYFIKDTKKMLLAPPSVGTIGSATIPDQNVGQLRNQGLELEASYKHTIGDVTFNVSGNATFIKNKITKLATPGGFLATQLYGRGQQEIVRTYEGQPYGTFYGYQTDGIYQNASEIDDDANIANDPRRTDGQIVPGDVRFVDLNNDGIVDDEDRTIIGSPQPKINYGFSAGANYKGFDFTLFFIGVGGVNIYNADRMQGLDASYPFNLYADALNSWDGEGSSNTIPRMSINNANRNFRPSDLFVEKGDYLRLKNMTLGYAIPKNAISKLKMSQARVYVTGQNLLTFTKYTGLNPELGYVGSGGSYNQLNVDYAQYPLARTWTIGATISF